jgi:CRP/FNR family transcriptional regulator, nitrogen fixation regulation protein
MAYLHEKNCASGVATRDQSSDLIRVLLSTKEPLVHGWEIQRALWALRRGPIAFRRNNIIACEGDSADYIFMVVSGVVRTCKNFQNGERAVIAFYLPGDLLGWADKAHPLSIEAASNATVLFFKRTSLVSTAARNNKVAGLLLDLATSELQRAQKHATLINRSTKSRVLHFLGDLSRRSGSRAVVSLPMPHQDIADHLGLTIETLSRTITHLQRSGLVSRKGTRALLLHDAHSLSPA